MKVSKSVISRIKKESVVTKRPQNKKKKKQTDLKKMALAVNMSLRSPEVTVSINFSPKSITRKRPTLSFCNSSSTPITTKPEIELEFIGVNQFIHL